MSSTSKFLSIFALSVLSHQLHGASLEQIQQRGKLVMISFPHMESSFVRPDLDALRASGGPLHELRSSEAYGGIDVEIVSAFAKELGVELEIHAITTSYADLIPALLEGHGDLIASSITITKERSQRVDFAVPYLSNWIVVAARPDSNLKSVHDLKGLRAAVMRGSSQLEYLKELEIPELELVLTDYKLENYLMLEDQRADFALFDSRKEPGRKLADSMPDAQVAFRLKPFGYGYALPPKSSLLGPLNEFLIAMKESGKIKEIADRHAK